MSCSCFLSSELTFRQDPLEAILNTFGRGSLIFFCLKALWKIWNNDTTIVCVRSGDHLGDSKMSKKAPRLVEFKCLTNPTDKNGFRRMNLEEGQIYKTLPQIC